MVTRCPQCATSFRITPAQLQSARGAVRCGACLHIFKARDHLVGASAPQPDPALVRKTGTQKAPVPKSKPAPEKPSGSKPDPARTHADTASERRPQKATRPSKPPREHPSSRPDNEKDAPQPHKTQGRQLRFDQSLIDSESGELDDDDFLISDDMGTPSEEEDSFGVISNQSVGHSLFERSVKDDEEEADQGDDTDESWAMSLLEEEEQDSNRAHLSPAEREISETPADFGQQPKPSFELVEDASEAQLAPGPDIDHLSVEPQDPDGSTRYGGERLQAHNPERSALLMNIDPEPVEMTWTRRHQHQSRRKWIWRGLALAALVVLAVQIAWLGFDRFSRIEPYRSAYAFLCPLVGCELPTLVDRERIRAYNLVVRNHPERDGALIVDAILLNNARFAQPFPELVLEFSDLNGSPLAAREFTPGEYLSGELAGRELMPPNQPIHLTLELVDPGEAAVNYRAYIPQ